MILETDRLLLRPLGIAYLDQYLALHDDPEVSRFVTRHARPAAEDRPREIAREWAEHGHRTFAVLDRATGRFIGRVLAPVRRDRAWIRFATTSFSAGRSSSTR